MALFVLGERRRFFMSFPFHIANSLLIPAEAPLGGKRYLVEINGEKFSLLHWDGPGPALLIVHANGFSGGTYAPLARALQDKGYNVMALDQRGHGRTPAEWTSAKHSWYTFGSDLAALVKEASEPIHLIGHSLGGLAAIYAAAEKPKHLASIALLDPTMFGPQFYLYFNVLKWTGLWQKIPMIQNTIHRTTHWNNHEEIFRHYRPKKVFAAFSNEFLWSYILSATKTAPAGGVDLACDKMVEAALFETTPHYIFGSLKKIATPPPTILLYGEHSYIVSKASVLTFKHTWPMAKAEEIPGGCHFFPMSHSDYVAFLLDNFFREVLYRDPVAQDN